MITLEKYLKVTSEWLIFLNIIVNSTVQQKL